MKYPQLVSMPSEISDWLEEQLEARGIDAVVYTRYILSLLHRDSVDVVCPDQDLPFTQPNKEVRRSGSGRKRFRCFSQWRDHAQADAEQLKRSAAIECLMSASDQNCGIESLVDELCEKLKEIKSDTAVNPESTTSSKSADLQDVSPQDLAKQYYAAFPPLTQHRTSGALIPKWISSPKKKGARRQNRSASFDEKLHYKIDTDSMKSRNNGKQRLGYFSRSRNDLGYSRSMAKSVERSESMTDWDLFMFSNNTKNKFSSNSNNNANSDKFGNITEEKAALSQNVELPEKPTKLDDNNRGLWNDEESMNICDDLPVDILELLDSPGPQDYTVEMMNLANMRDAGNKNFIQCGTNITSSIWSIDPEDTTMFDNNYNTALDADQSETLLGMKFKSLTVGNKSIESIWSNSDVAENETNLLFENYRKSSLLNFVNENCFGENNFSLGSAWDTSGIEKLEKWSEAEYFDNEAYLRNVTKSFSKLNHNKEESSFTEVMPKANSNTFNIFAKTASGMVHMLTNSSSHKKQAPEKEEDNLLTSVRSHFRPINTQNCPAENRIQKQYANGTSFVISGSLDVPNYKRSDSGSEYLESDCGSPKKLLEFKNKLEKPKRSALVLKFFVCQNDKACQTDDALIKNSEMDNSQEVPCKKRVMSEPEEFFFPGDEEFLMDEPKLCKCTCPQNTNKSATNLDFSFGDDLVTCPLHLTRPDSMLAEMWKGESKQCEKCSSNNTSWNGNWAKVDSVDPVWQLNKTSLQSIWNGGEVCPTCLDLNGGRPPLSSQQSQLREDISQDGEQLLSDLSTLQKSYMEQLPAAEISYDISELITGSKERKRRHSPIVEAAKNAVPVHRGSWSIASHMKQDRFMQVTSIPVLHSVTL